MLPVEPTVRIRTLLVASPTRSARPTVDLVSDGVMEVGGRGRLRGGRDAVADEGEWL